LRYARALPVNSVAGKAMPRHVLRRLAITLRSEYASVIKRSGGRVEGLIARLHENIEARWGIRTTNSATN